MPQDIELDEVTTHVYADPFKLGMNVADAKTAQVAQFLFGMVATIEKWNHGMITWGWHSSVIADYIKENADENTKHLVEEMLEKLLDKVRES